MQYPRIMQLEGGRAGHHTQIPRIMQSGRGQSGHHTQNCTVSYSAAPASLPLSDLSFKLILDKAKLSGGGAGTDIKI
jgi:hypothetical protein